MFETLAPQPPDKIIELIGMFCADPRADKVDLGVGVYKDAGGATPVMRAVREAERRKLQEQTSKSYLGLAGDLDFVDAMRMLALGNAVESARVAGIQTPGGTGAVHQLVQLIKLARPEATVWYSDPTWPNHPAILRHVGLAAKTYRYFDEETCGTDIAGMMEDLSGIAPGDVVLLHGCCHNPTGAKLALADWQAITALMAQKGAVPLVDLAYQGFGDGLEADVQGLRAMVAALPETMIAVSCSKNFGLYRDRVGAALVVGGNRERTQGALASLNRLTYSFPPDHGAKLVAMIMADPALRADWEAELDEMRARMLRLREAFAVALRDATGSDRFGFVAGHRGMFSRLGLSPQIVTRLRDEHGVYIVGDSRMNVAGLPENGLGRLAEAITQCLRDEG